MTIEYPKRLIEVDLPIKRISAQARREKSIRHGHISTLHIWWARRPLAACRAVVCAALWPDPVDSLCPQSFRDAAVDIVHEFAVEVMRRERTQKLLDQETQRWSKIANEQPLDPNREHHWEILQGLLLDFIAAFSNWDASTEECFLKASRALTQAAHEALGGEPGTRPMVVDPFAGGGAIPLEALRVGADAFASELLDLPVFLNKLMIEEIAESTSDLEAEYSKWANVLLQRVKKRIKGIFPTNSKEEKPFAYFWARTVYCEAPSCGKRIPLIGSPHLSKRKNSRNSIIIEYPKGSFEPTVFLSFSDDKRVRSTVKGGAALCVCGFTTEVSSVRRQLSALDGGADESTLLAVGLLSENKKKSYRLPNNSDYEGISLARRLKSEMSGTCSSPERLSPFPDEKLWGKARMNVGLYGMDNWQSIFTTRQLVQLRVYQEELQKLAVEERLGETVVSLLAITINKLVDYSTSLCRWVPKGEFVAATIGAEKKLGMMWDFPEVVLHESGPGSWTNMTGWVKRVLTHFCRSELHRGIAVRSDARTLSLPDDSAQSVITDPPYYDAIWYGDLSDIFSVWLRRTMRMLGREFEYNLLEQKEGEVIRSSFSQKDGLTPKNDAFYEAGLFNAFDRARRILCHNGIAVIVFAHKSTAGWEAVLSALMDSGWIITSSWPIDTEREVRMTSFGQAALSSSIHIVCRPRENPDGSLQEDTVGDWRDVLAELPDRIHAWMPRLAQEGVVGADAIFACLGPALEIFSQYSRVEKASGERVTLREYLEQVWAAVAREALNMIFEGADTTGFEEDARLTAMWLWTLSTSTNGKEPDEAVGEKLSSTGYQLEYDAARKIAQGLGAHLEQLRSLIEIKGDKARLLPVSERTRFLFGKDEQSAPSGRRKKKSDELNLFAQLEEAEHEEGGWGEKNAPALGNTTLDRVHQSMILFAANRGEAIRRFLIEEGAGRDERFWRLAQSLSALYPPGSDEKRWIDGLLARKKGLGF